MQITIPYQYTENIISKRCRKSRDVRFDDEVTLEIREFTEADVPIAIIEYDSNGHQSLVFRWLDGKLWTSATTVQKETYRSLDDCFYSLRYSAYKPQEERLDEFFTQASEVILIDGQIYRVAGEPRYVVMTFGLGCNHGGTALMANYLYNSNIGASHYYRIDQREEAIAEAERIAEARGDTDNIPIYPHTDYKIFISEAIQCHPQREHGSGDPFMNDMEASIEAVKNPLVAGLLGIAKLFG